MFSRFIHLLTIATLLGTPAAAQTMVVDGFSVTVLPAPTEGMFSKKPDVADDGTVLYETGKGNDNYGINPYDYSKKLTLDTPFLSIQARGAAAFVLKAPATQLTILWGSPDPQNALQFFDSSGAQIGNTMNGADLKAAFNLPPPQPYYITITVPTAFTKAALSSNSCCFEFSAVSSQ